MARHLRTPMFSPFIAHQPSCFLHRPWSPCQSCFHFPASVFANSAAWSTLLCPCGLFRWSSLGSDASSLKGIFFSLTTLFNRRAICHHLCDFGLDMTRVIGNEEMAEKLRPGVLCNWMKTHQPRPLNSMLLLYRAQMMFITVWGLCGLQSSGTRNPQSLLCIHTVNIHTYTRGRLCHPPEPDPG